MKARPSVALALATILVAGCGAATPSAAPGRPSTSARPATTSSSPPSVEPTGSVLPSPSTASVAISPGPGRWMDAGTLPSDFSESHAVPLGDGRVLLVGTPSEGTSTTAVIWDPSTDAWRATEPLNKSRFAFELVPTSDGGALVIGGTNQDDQSFSSTYRFDAMPGRETWVKTGLLGTARSAPSAVTLADGRVLVMGGYVRHKPQWGMESGSGVILAAFRPASAPSDDRGSADIDPPNVGAALATTEIYDPATGEWRRSRPMRYARFGAPAVTLSDGRVLIVGSGAQSEGVTVDGAAYTRAELFDPATGQFTPAGRLPEIDRQTIEAQGQPGANPIPDSDPDVERMGQLIALDDGGAVLIAWSGWWKHVGDVTRSFRFDPSSASWSEIGSTWLVVGEPTPITLRTVGVRSLSGAGAARLGDGRIVIAGGGAPTGIGGTEANSPLVDVYDPATNEWSRTTSMPEVRTDALAIGLADGSALLIGGRRWNEDGSSQAVGSAARYVP